MITDERLDELAAMEADTKQGPWRASFSEAIAVDAAYGFVMATIGEEKDCLDENGELDDMGLEAMCSDAAFIAAARNEFAAMIAQCREANRLSEEKRHWHNMANMLADRLAIYTGRPAPQEMQITEERLEGQTP